MYSRRISLIAPASGLRVSCDWALSRRSSSRRVVHVRASGNKDEVDGDHELQNELESMIMLETGKARVDQYVQDKGEMMSEMVEEASLA